MQVYRPDGRKIPTSSKRKTCYKLKIHKHFHETLLKYLLTSAVFENAAQQYNFFLFFFYSHLFCFSSQNKCNK